MKRPPSSALVYALEYGNTHLIPLLTPIWPLPDDLCHAAGVGGFARVTTRDLSKFLGDRDKMPERTFVPLAFLGEIVIDVPQARFWTISGLPTGVFRSVNDLIAAITDYVAHYNKDPKPFIWTASASDILEKVKQARTKLDTLL